MKAIILAAAQSERLRPFTETRAKPMIRIAGTTILESTCTTLKAAGVTELLIVVNHKRESIEAVMEHGHNHGLSIDYVLQDPIDGIGGALLRCAPYLDDGPFLLVYGDVLATGNPVSRVLHQHTETGRMVAALALPGSSREFGNVYLNPEMRITRLVEKPSDPHLSNYVFAGFFLLQPEVLGLLKQQDGDMESVWQALIAKERLHGALWEGNWIDIQRPWQILEANRMLMDRWDQAIVHRSVRLEGQVNLHGPVHLEAGVVIGSGTTVRGPCYIGKGSYVGNNALVRPYTSIGPDSIVGYGTELKNCVLLGRSVLGRLSYIGDSVIGENVHLGTGVTTVNQLPSKTLINMEGQEGPVNTGLNKVGAFIGDDVNIGARHVLAPGTRIHSKQVIDDMITLRSTF